MFFVPISLAPAECIGDIFLFGYNKYSGFRHIEFFLDLRRGIEVGDCNFSLSPLAL